MWRFKDGDICFNELPSTLGTDYCLRHIVENNEPAMTPSSPFPPGAIEAFNEAKQVAALHTDCLLHIDSQTKEKGLASCVYLLWEKEVYAITCEHVLRPERVYFAGAKRIYSILDGGAHEVENLKLLASNKRLDLAVFRTNVRLAEIPKEAYALPTDGSYFGFERAARNKGTLVFIAAAPGFLSGEQTFPNDSVFLEAGLYKAMGPIVDVLESKIVGDFAEQMVIGNNTDGSLGASPFIPTGGTRDLSGMSGSGLWGKWDGSIHLLGILRGPDEENDPLQEHRIKFCPVWKVREWLGAVIPPRTVSAKDASITPMLVINALHKPEGQ